MNFEHRLQHVRGRTDVADAPARHRVGLRKPVHQHGALAHAWDLNHAGVHAAVDETAVNFVGEHEQIVALCDLSDLRELGALDYGAGRIVRVAQQDELAARHYRVLDLAGAHGEAVLDMRARGGNRSAGEDHVRLVGDIARIRDDDLVVWIEQRAHGGVDAFANADRDHDLRRRVVGDTVATRDEVGDGLTQLERAVIGGIVRLAQLDGGNASLANVLGSDEIWLTDAQ